MKPESSRDTSLRELRRWEMLRTHSGLHQRIWWEEILENTDLNIRPNLGPHQQ